MEDDALDALKKLQVEHERVNRELNFEKGRYVILEAIMKGLDQHQIQAAYSPNIVTGSETEFKNEWLNTPEFQVPVPGGYFAQIGNDPHDPFQFYPNAPVTGQNSSLDTTPPHNHTNFQPLLPERSKTDVGLRGNRDNDKSIKEFEVNTGIDKGHEWNELILRNLSKFLSQKTLKIGRLVCNHWHATLTEVLSKQSRMVLDFYCREAEDFRKVSNDLLDAFPIAEFYAKDLKPSFPNTLILILNPMNPPQEVQVVLQWLQSYSDKVKDITITSANYSALFPADLMVKMIQSCPNIDTLRISNPSIQGSFHASGTKLFPTIKTLILGYDDEFGRAKYRFEDGESDFTTSEEKVLASYQEIAKSMPKLRAFKIYESRLSDYYSGLFVKFCKNNGYWEDLLELQFMVCFGRFNEASSLEWMSEIQFNSLKKLGLKTSTLIFSRTAAAALHKILLNARDNLEDLSLKLTIFSLNLEDPDLTWLFESHSFYDQPRGVQFRNHGIASVTLSSLPEITKLKTFEVDYGLEFEQGSIDFVQKFPNLQSLILKEQMDENTLFRLLPLDLEIQHDSLRVLKLPNCTITNRPMITTPLKFQTLNLITKSFPSLEELEIRLSPSYEMEPYNTFKHELFVLNGLSKLKDLTITIERVLDEDLNSSLSEMFDPNGRVLFLALKRFTLKMSHRELGKINWLHLDAVEHFNEANSLEYLEFNNFFLQTVNFQKDFSIKFQNINRVHFVKCLSIDILAENREELRKHDYAESWYFETGRCNAQPMN